MEGENIKSSPDGSTPRLQERMELRFQETLGLLELVLIGDLPWTQASNQSVLVSKTSKPPVRNMARNSALNWLCRSTCAMYMNESVRI